MKNLKRTVKEYDLKKIFKLDDETLVGCKYDPKKTMYVFYMKIFN
jgi:hypothetical protein